MVGIFDVAKTVCKMAGWNLSPLELQKIMYILQMFHIGKYESPLFYANFKAWKFGPVEPSLYQKLRRYGSSKVSSLVFVLDDFVDENTAEWKFIQEYTNKLLNKSASWLLNYTHAEIGAWKRIYKEGEEHEDDAISNDDIWDEYQRRAIECGGVPDRSLDKNITKPVRVSRDVKEIPRKMFVEIHRLVERVSRKLFAHYFLDY